MLRAESVDVPTDDRSQLTDDQMRELVLPGDDGQRTAATAAGQFKLMVDKAIANKAERGAHVVFSLVSDGTSSQPEVYDQIALTDPKRTRVHLLTVHCTQACYTANQKQIEDVVTSLTLKAH